MVHATRSLPALLVVALALGGGLAGAQFSDDPADQMDPIPPPLPKPDVPRDAAEYESIVSKSDAPWGLEAEMLDRLHAAAGLYQAYARQFTCNETARVADYDETGDVKDERTRRYGYLLLRGDSRTAFREYRQLLGKDGQLRASPVEDAEPFPPAYMWAFLFSRFNEPFFAYRHVRTDFEGYDVVHEIEFRGSLPFTDGRDIRQWEGVVLVDAFRYTPLEIRAEPSGQGERIEALYRNWAKSFNVMGFRSAKRPLGYRASLQFRFRRDELTFPTEVRYDTAQAVSPSRLVPIKASTRTYDSYRFVDVEVDETIDTGRSTAR